MSTNYDINYNDKRFTDVEADKKAAIKDNAELYDGMIKQSDDYYQSMIDASKDWANTQTDIQNQKTDQAIKEINQQKDQAKKDYTKEQSGAYVDWQKQSNPYGASSEQMAAAGLAGTGYSESSLVSMYNTYQNRVTAARESYNLAVQNYNNAITQARLQNSSILAEIANEALQKQLELSLQGFQYKNTLLTEKANRQIELDEMYHGRYQDVLNQINTENSLAEQVRQHNEKMAEEKRQYNESLAFQKEQFAEEKRQFNVLHPVSSGGSISKPSGGSGGSSGGSGGGSSINKNKTSGRSRNDYVKKMTVDEKNKHGGTTSASSYLNQLIASGASKDKVANEISIALREGAITKEEAARLRKTFTPRGLAY